MPQPMKKPATYDDLFVIPEHATGQIIAGELIVTPRPSREHARVESALCAELTMPFDFGRGGPGGWLILVEPEIRLGDDFLVPDLAGWHKERFPVAEEHNWISATPDWICEILSPRSVRLDRITKMSLYRDHAVPHVWLIDPAAKTLEIFGLGPARAWVTLGLYAGEQAVRAEPFQDVEIGLGHLWLE